MGHAVPLTISLPGGFVAEYAPGSNPPYYTIGGEVAPIDVRIPEDILAAGWLYSGAYLVHRSDPLRGVFVHLDTFPPPGWPSRHADCFTAVRTMMAIDVAARLQTGPKAKAKGRRHTDDD